ncbi:MAG: TetR/AcrR family transcriptional regulator [Deltaproteobacteria bacterium]|nr:TetR/AcrR family transcriptional regulator [Deltaproteobacteria bacterium]
MKKKGNDSGNAQKIVDAVRTVIKQKGYAGTTITEVSKEAGVSRGLLHYYFKSKEDMIVQSIKTGERQDLASIEEWFSNMDATGNAVETFLNRTREEIRNRLDYYILYYEGLLLARHNRMIAEEIDRFTVKAREALQRGIENIVQRGIISPKVPIDRIGVFMVALNDGITTSVLSNPDIIDDDLFWDAFKLPLQLIWGEDTA